MAELSYPEISPEVCFTAQGYSGQYDYDDMYLGFDNFLKTIPTVKLEAIFNTDDELIAFINWWREEVLRGKEIFLLTASLFGREGTYGVRQISPFTHTNVPNHKLKFSVEVVFDSSTVDNNIPTAEAMTVYVEQDSRDNFIVLRGNDLDNDVLEYVVTLSTAKGTLAGTPPQMLYTPDEGYLGDDCFNFEVFDRWAGSVQATVEIVVGAKEHADFKVRYKVTAPIRIGGNYHYDTGNGVIVRGTGGIITPDANNIITIYSNGHDIDERDVDFVTDVIIDNWGDRTNFSNFLKGMTNITLFSFSDAIGTCVGTDFSGFFWGCSIQYVSVFDTINGTDFTDMFRECTIGTIPPFDYSNGIYFVRMFKDATTDTVHIMNTVKGQYFQDMFFDASLMTCIGGIDTLQFINTGNMFQGATALVNPTVQEQTEIKAGSAWVNTVAPCKISVDNIVQNAVASCDIANIGGSCTSSTTYTVNYSGELGAPTYTWSVINGTIVIDGTETSQTITVTTTSGSPVEIGISCIVNDGTNAVDSGTYNFLHQRNELFLTLDIPKQYAELDLRAFIDDNNPTNETQVLLTNKIINCSMKTGDLTGLTVELRNTGEIQGFDAGLANASLTKNNGLNITSEILLDNFGGIISGCGGNGGKGGKGANDSYSVSNTETRTGSYAKNAVVWRQCTNYTQVAWSDVYVHYTGNVIDNGPFTVGGVSGLYKGNYRYEHKGANAVCDHAGYDIVYDIKRIYTTTKSRTGGAGGAGGTGLGYGVVSGDGGNQAWREADSGSVSSPTGGNSGGAGGQGGYWGDVGADGSRGAGNGDYGTIGYTAGKAITGSSLLAVGSDTGTTNGEVA